MAVGMRSHGWTIFADSSLHVRELFLCIDELYCHFGSRVQTKEVNVTSLVIRVFERVLFG